MRIEIITIAARKFFRIFAMKRNAAGLPLSYRLAVTSRSLAALLGGYLLASMASVCISLLLPLPQVDAALTGMMLSFVFYLLAFICCFACRSAWRAWRQQAARRVGVRAAAVAQWPDYRARVEPFTGGPWPGGVDRGVDGRCNPVGIRHAVPAAPGAGAVAGRVGQVMP